MNDKISFSISLKDARIIFLTLLVLVGAFLIFNNLSVPFARTWDIRYGYYASLITFIVFIVGLIVNAKEIVLRTRAHLPSSKSLLALFCLLGFFTVFSWNHIENSHRVLSDETSWESMGLQMYFDHTGGICNEGIWKDGVLDCHTEVNNFKGKTLGFVYSLVFHFAEPNRDTALLVNYPFYLLSLIAFFLALSIWFKSDWRALAATVFLGGMPIYLMLSRSASTEVLYICIFSLLLAWYALVPPKEVKWKHFLLTVPLLGFFSGTRQETVFAFIPFGLYYVRYFRGEFYRLPLFVLSVIAVSWPAVNTMAAYRGFDFQGGTHAAHSFSNFWFNLKTDIQHMLSLESDLSHGGIMNDPFYTTFTILLLLATAWLLYRMIFKKRYRRGFILGILFCLQIFVILFNVSGTFEIDINQRYVLVALPMFALIMALGLSDCLETCGLNFKKSSSVAAAVAIFLSVGLAIWHTSSFDANMLYYKNKLLGEENYLNSYLKTFPKNSIYIYARPWQMLASGYSSFSERTFMGWTADEFAKYQNETNGNIYLVRGQDGYGQVNRESRVVGFKTTDQITSILDGYKVEKILAENRLFGYPLTLHKIVSKHGLSLYAQGISVSDMQIENAAGSFALTKNFPESVAYRIWLGDSVASEGTLDSTVSTVSLANVSSGLSRYRFDFYVPDDTVRITRDVFVEAPGVKLLSSIPIVSYTQDWGEPQTNESVEHHTMQLNGETYRFGIGSHATSKMSFNLPEAYETFHAVVGLDDESACGDGAEFIVIADGKKVWQSKRLYVGESYPVQVKIAGARQFELQIDQGGDRNCDHGDWANAWFSSEVK